MTNSIENRSSTKVSKTENGKTSIVKKLGRTVAAILISIGSIGGIAKTVDALASKNPAAITNPVDLNTLKQMDEKNKPDYENTNEATEIKKLVHDFLEENILNRRQSVTHVNGEPASYNSLGFADASGVRMGATLSNLEYNVRGTSGHQIGISLNGEIHGQDNSGEVVYSGRELGSARIAVVDRDAQVYGEPTMIVISQTGEAQLWLLDQGVGHYLDSTGVSQYLEQITSQIFNPTE